MSLYYVSSESPFDLSGRSKLTLLPWVRVPKLVRLIVSGTASADQEVSLYSVTVKQHPFTAMDAPIEISAMTVFALRVSLTPEPEGVILETIPTSSIIPVNTFLPVRRDEKEKRHVEAFKFPLPSGL